VNIFWANTGAAEQAIESLPDVDSVQVRCTLPANCLVKVKERAPTLVWRQGDAQVWIGSDGMVLPPRGELPYSLVIEAADGTALRPGDQVDASLVRAVEELEELLPDVRTYRYSSEVGLSFQNAHGWEVRLGDGAEIDVKLRLLDALTHYLVEQGITPGYLDVRYPQAPYYRE
jgi:cell division septal protein FtsQ